MTPIEKLLQHGDRHYDTRADLARALKISSQLLHSWTIRGIPANKQQEIARFLGITVDELLRDTKPSIREPPAPYTNQVEAGPPIRSQIPVIADTAAGHWKEIVDNLHPGEGEAWMDTTIRTGPHAFALRVTSDSMEPKICPGMLVIVDPDADPRPGDYVVVRWNGGSTVKQWIRDAGVDWLRPENDRYPLQRMPDHAEIIGVVRQAGWIFR